MSRTYATGILFGVCSERECVWSCVSPNENEIALHNRGHFGTVQALELQDGRFCAAIAPASEY
ncbi:hypothetical protein LC605_24875 [Nostoc sp. CHAB 5836]|uniref:hypothetical protein n=1 Tax=Nostoc sp. CHAB 5836 TaxID=2780404 RepID=UPI001E2B41FB|nr:hypothetical protein [Nostoc sp. CHAB 5836]MCC5618261.1 hypothetical protein [Nostoc sp. CHAB 5836]